jgi:hypothetical protein
MNNHRNEVEKLLSIAMELIDDKKIALILGSGNTNDLSVPDLAENFKHQVTLLDIDEITMKRVMNSLDPFTKKKVKSEIRDISGLFGEKSVFGEFFDSCVRQDTGDALKVIDRWISAPENVCPSTFLIKRYDLVMSSNVSAHLIAPISLLASRLLPILHDMGISKLAHIAALNHVIQIHDLLKDNGIGIIISEQFEITPDHCPVENLLDKPELLLDKGIQKFLEQNNFYMSGRIVEEYIELINLKIHKRHQWICTNGEKGNYLIKGWVVSKN